MKKKFVLFVCFFVGYHCALAQHPKWLEKDSTLLLKDQDMKNWEDAKFGLFVHYGLYALLERGEWVQFTEQIDVAAYAKLKDKFTASKFDGAQWVQAAKEAGCRYMVVTSRHHDGFSLFNTRTDDFNSINSPAHKDLIAEYIAACRSAGLLAGIYYSPLDWRYPGFFFPDLYRSNAELMKKQTYNQIRELLSDYGKVDILWYDGGGDDWLSLGGLKYTHGSWHSRDREHEKYQGGFRWEPIKLNTMVRQLQPKIVINSRSGMVGDFDVMEAHFSNNIPKRPWEYCTTLTYSGWGWKKNTPILTADSCIRLLVRTVTQGGNFCLNVGPRPDGDIDTAQLRVLKQIGVYMNRFGESIYATRKGVFDPSWGGTTVTPRAIYVHVLHIPESGKIMLPAIPQKIVKAVRLADGKKVRFEQNEKEVIIPSVTHKYDQTDLVIKLHLQ